jgi:7-carboxy-7-deazaguanine synthase
MLVTEIFYSLQGEGSRRGRPCAFVRLTGCPLRCTWCDTAYAFHGGKEMSVQEILDELATFPTHLICVTGGEPLAQAETRDLLTALIEADYEVVLETSGALDIGGCNEFVIMIMDWKAPASGEVTKNLLANVELLRPEDEVKFVLQDRLDYDWACGQLLAHRFDQRVDTVLFSPVHGKLDPAELAAWILEDGLPVVLQLQQHKLLWPDQRRGV